MEGVLARISSNGIKTTSDGQGISVRELVRSGKKDVRELEPYDFLAGGEAAGVSADAEKLVENYRMALLLGAVAHEGVEIAPHLHNARRDLMKKLQQCLPDEATELMEEYENHMRASLKVHIGARADELIGIARDGRDSRGR